MNAIIVSFLVFGACFGLATFSHQHLFSEGVSERRSSDGGLDVGARLLWAMVCTFLWPLMVLTGLYGWYRVSRQPVRSDGAGQRRR